MRAVITVTLPSPDVGGEFAATLIKQAAEESGYTGQLPVRVELWPASDNPPHDFEGAGSVEPGTVGNRIASQELFQFRQTGLSKEGNAEGFHTATGLRSVHLDHFAERGEPLPLVVFEPTARAGATSAAD